jgi:ATP-binding cassette, subfamily B, bacterial
MKNKLLSFSKSIRFVFQLTFSVDKKLFFLNFFFFILMAVLPLASFWVLKILVDKIVELKSIFHEAIYIYIALFIFIQILYSFVQQWSAYFLQKQQYLLSEYISLKVLNKAGEIDYSYYEDPSFYDALHMTQNQSSFLPPLIISTLQTLIQQFISVVALTGFLLTVHWSIPILLITLSLPLAISKLIFGQRQFQLEKSIVPEKRKANDYFHYVTSSIYAKELRLFNFGSFFINRYHAFQLNIYEKRNKLQFLFLKKGMLISFFEVIFVTFFYLILIGRSIKGSISLGGLIIYFQAFQRLQTSLNTFFKSGVTLFQHQLYLQEILNYLSLPALRSEKNGTVVSPDITISDISIRNLYFRYPETEKDVLQDISMQFHSGKFIAIVGENGSGKSTVLKLLCGLYKTNRGSLAFNGINSNDLPASFFNKHISVVFQDFGKYYLTVEDNIAIGQATTDPERIKNVLQSATGSDLLTSLHAGMGTTLGRTHNLGEEISGGQWQKIAIARALYKDSEVLVLDEPTSSIDPLAELEFFSNLKQHLGNRLIILITHRLYNLKLADYIYVMEDARVRESGTFQDLIDKQGYFSTYYNAQKI